MRGYEPLRTLTNAVRDVKNALVDMIRHMRGIRIALATAIAVVFAAGCGVRSEQREENHPLMRRALALKRANDLDGAIAAFQKALDRNPDLARAHLHLAMIYDEDPVAQYLLAVYHYERYVAISRDEKTRALAVDLSKRAHLSFAAALPNPPTEALRMIADQKKEIASLRSQIRDLQLRSAPPTPAPSPAPAAARPSGDGPSLPRPAPAPAVAHAQTYTVQGGDTLSVIAGKMYGDHSQWQKIYDANKGILPSPGSVRPGQVLVIPR